MIVQPTLGRGGGFGVGVSSLVVITALVAVIQITISQSELDYPHKVGNDGM